MFLNEIKQFLNQIDLFGLPIFLYFNTQPRHSTVIGQIASLSIYVFLLYSFFQSDLYLKLSPFTSSQSIALNHAERVSYDEDHFMAFSLCDGNSKNYIDDTIFNAIFLWHHLKTDDNGIFQEVNATNYELRACTMDDVAFNPSLFISLGLNNALCLKNKSFFLEGYWNEPEIYYAEITLYMCNNDTSNVTCKSQEEMALFLDASKYFNIYFHSATVDLNNYQNPVGVTHINDYALISTQLSKTYNILMQNLRVMTDDGMFFPSISQLVDIMFNSYQFDFSTYQNDDLLFQFNLYASASRIEQSRTYQNFPQLLASLLGIMHLFKLMASIFLNLHNYIITIEVLLNSLYFFPSSMIKTGIFHNKKESEKLEMVLSKEKLKFDRVAKFPKDDISLEQLKPQRKSDIFSFEHFLGKASKIDIGKHEKPNEVDKERKKKQFSKKFKKGSPEESSSEIRVIRIENNNLQRNNNISVSKKKFSDKRKNEKENTLNFNLLQYIKSKVLCWNNFKANIINHSEELYKSELDIVKILTKIHEIEKLKIILMDEDQRTLFHTLSKPFIIEEECVNDNHKASKRKSSRMVAKFKISNKDQNLVESYNRIYSTKGTNQINARLIELVDKNLLEMEKNK